MGEIPAAAGQLLLHPLGTLAVSQRVAPLGRPLERYGASRVPKGSTVEDWPFGYEELEPYYDKIEYELGVSGQAGNVNGKIDARGNPFEAPRRREYPMPHSVCDAEVLDIARWLASVLAG